MHFFPPARIILTLSLAVSILKKYLLENKKFSNLVTFFVFILEFVTSSETKFILFNHRRNEAHHAGLYSRPGYLGSRGCSRPWGYDAGRVRNIVKG